MDGYFYNRRKSLIFKVLCSILVVFFFTLSVVPPGYAQMVPMSLNLPAPGAVLPISPGYAPTLVKGLAINPQNPLEFDFFVDPGDSGMKGEEFKTEANKLIKYFLASLTIAEEDLWVNLSPYEEGRIIPDTFGQTEMGRDLLAQDYILKQLTASMMYPENELGQKFWNKVYDEAQAKFGTREIPMSTFNKIWIVPERATIYINGNNVFVADTHLKVLLEEDYVALRKDDTAISGKSNESLTDDDMEEISETSSAVIREVLLPAIEKEINEGQNFANLRQINNSLTLAVWYKKNLKESLLGQVYADQGKVKGIEQDDVRANREIYNRYVEAFKTGVYDYIKEEYDPSTQSLVSRKYFSGGFGLNLTQTTPAGTVRELSYAERINEVRKDINSNRSIDNIAVKKLASTTDDISRFQVMLEAPRSTPQDRAMIINNNDGGESLFQNLKGSTDQELEVARENNFQENIKRIRRGEEAFIVLKNLSGNLKKEFGPDIHDEVVALLKDSGFEVEVISTKTVNEEEADGWYGVHKGRILENGDNLYEKLVEVNTQGPSVMLLVKKEGYQGDALYKYLQDEIRTKVRQKYNRSQKDYDNIMHVSDTVKSATEEFSKINRPRLLLSATNQISNKAVNDPVVGPILNEFLASYKFMQNHDRLDAFAGRNSEKRAEIINEQDTEIYGPVFDTLSQIAELREQGKVNPEGVKLRLSKNDAQVTQADQNLDGRRARVGYLPMKGDPWQAGHIFVILEAVAKFGLDKVVISIDNGDYRKDELSSLTIRQAITKKVLENLGVMVEFTTMTAEEESLWKADGEQSMFFLSQLNKDIDIDWFYMGGSDHANWTKMIEQTDSETGAKKMVEDLDIPSKLVRNIKQGLYGFFDGGRHTINVIFSERPGVKPLTEDQLNALRREVGKELPNSSQLREMGKIVQPMNTSSSRVRKDGDFWTVLMSAYQFADAFQFWGLQTPEVQAEQEVLGKDLITLVQQGLDNTAEKDIIIKQVEERLSNATGVGMNIFDFFLMRKLSEDLQNREWLMEVRQKVFDRGEQIADSVLNENPLRPRDQLMKERIELYNILSDNAGKSFSEQNLIKKTDIGANKAKDFLAEMAQDSNRFPGVEMTSKANGTIDYMVRDNAMIVNNNSAPDVILNSTSRDFRDSIQAGNILIEHLQAVIKGEVSAKRSLIPLWTSLRYGKTVSLEELDPVYNRIDVMLEAISEELDKNGIMNESYFETVGDSKDVKEIGLLLQGTSNDAEKVVVALSRIIRNLQENNDVFRRQIALGEKKEDKAMFFDIHQITNLQEEIVSGDWASSPFVKTQLIYNFIDMIETNIRAGMVPDEEHRRPVKKVLDYLEELISRAEQPDENISLKQIVSDFDEGVSAHPEMQGQVDDYISNLEKIIDYINQQKIKELNTISREFSLMDAEVSKAKNSEEKDQSDMQSMLTISRLKNEVLENNDVSYQSIENIKNFYAAFSTYNRNNTKSEKYYEHYKSIANPIRDHVKKLQTMLLEYKKDKRVFREDVFIALKKVLEEKGIEDIDNIPAEKLSELNTFLQTVGFFREYSTKHEHLLGTIYEEMLALHLRLQSPQNPQSLNEYRKRDGAMLVKNRNSTPQDYRDFIQAGNIVIRNLQSVLKGEVKDVHQVPLWTAVKYGKTVPAVGSTDAVYNRIDAMLDGISEELIQSGITNTPYFETTNDGEGMTEIGINLSSVTNSDQQVVIALSKVIGRIQQNNKASQQQIALSAEKEDKAMFSEIPELYGRVMAGRYSLSLFEEIKNIRLFINAVEDYATYGVGMTYIDGYDYSRLMRDVEDYVMQRIENIKKRINNNQRAEYISKNDLEVYFKEYFQNDPDAGNIIRENLSNVERLLKEIKDKKTRDLQVLHQEFSALDEEIRKNFTESQEDDDVQQLEDFRDAILEDGETSYAAIQQIEDYFNQVKSYYGEKKSYNYEQYNNLTDPIIKSIDSMQRMTLWHSQEEIIPAGDIAIIFTTLQDSLQRPMSIEQRESALSMTKTLGFVGEYTRGAINQERQEFENVQQTILAVQSSIKAYRGNSRDRKDQAMLVKNQERFDHYAKAYKTVLKNLTNALNEQVSGNAQKIKLWGAEDYDDINIAAAYAIEGSSTDEAFNTVNEVILDVMRDLSAKVNKDPEHRWADPISFESKMNYNPGEFYFDIKEDGRNIKEMGIQFYNSDAKDILKVLGATRDDLAKGIQELEKPFEESTAYNVYGSILDQYNEIKKYYDSNTMDDDEFLELNNIRLSGLSEMLRYLFHSFGHKAFIEENIFEQTVGDIERLQDQTAKVLVRRAQSQPKKGKDSQDQAMLIGDGYYQNREVYIEAYKNVLENLTKALSDKNKMLMDREVILWRAEDFKNSKIPMAESMFPDTDDQMYNFMLEISSELMSEVSTILERDNSNVNIDHIFVPGDEEGRGEAYVQSMGVSVGNADIIDFIRAFEKAKVVMENAFKSDFNPDSKSDRAMLIQDVNTSLEEIYTELDAIALDYKNGKVNKSNVEYYLEELSDQQRQMLDLFVNLKMQGQVDKINEGLVKNAYRLNKSLAESFADVNSNTVDISLENLSLEAIYDAINDVSLELENGKVTKDNLSDYKETLRRLQNRMIDYSENLIINRDNSSQADVILIKNAHQVGKVLADKLNQFNDKAVGGIDLNPASLNLEIRRDSNGIPLPVSQQPLQQINVEGFVPVIINVTPVSNFPLLLGLTETEDDSNIGYDSLDAYDRKVSVYDRKLKSQI